MNINEADQTYSLISRSYSDNFMRYSLFFLTVKSFHFRNERLPLHMIFNVWFVMSYVNVIFIMRLMLKCAILRAKVLMKLNAQGDLLSR